MMLLLIGLFLIALGIAFAIIWVSEIYRLKSLRDSTSSATVSFIDFLDNDIDEILDEFEKGLYDWTLREKNKLEAREKIKDLILRN